MKGPSLDAIRKFKEQQERKKRDEETKKIEDKMNTLQHRAAQGDRKAKVLIKKIEEESKNSRNLNTEPTKEHNHGYTQKHSHGHHHNGQNRSAGATTKKPNIGLTDFDELMRLAATNKNEVKEKRKPKEVPRIKKIIKVDTERVPPPSKQPPPSKSPMPSATHRPTPKPVPTPIPTPRPMPGSMSRPIDRPISRHTPGTSRVVRIPQSRYEDEPDYEDEYESDGFVVDDDAEEARAELNKTLRDVFRYDKRRADRLEREVDMHYHAIGRVSTFDDLEREERRASRLAQIEDAIEQRNEEERKRKKQQRLKSRR